MRRADRLFQIILLLSGGRIRTAGDIAARLEVSERTIYRDITDLASSGVPIDGEAGVGYRLRPGYHVPPLMFDLDEIQALQFGAGVASAWADDRLKAAADRLLAKIEAVLPDRLRQQLLHSPLLVPPDERLEDYGAVLAQLREAITGRQVVALNYRAIDGRETRRHVRPLVLLFWGRTWTLGAWCELRTDFRTFRVDRIITCEILQRRYASEAGRSLNDYLQQIRAGEDS
jgi:predicted DNA-binding transcriptional regulator YafY